jgi:hypothetical protein
MIDIQPDQIIIRLIIRQGGWRNIVAACCPSQFHNMPDEMK